ncbi:unnamed protein product [Phyllotreta striolata]|uniref:Luciferin 4-monooxygenase-like n=1 Tax=Phyllotreta striolata TaxID=444603 RepID=A0A9P0GW29_PHYSR|nr:unnamed protein product [Phyllotreta striolata]
MNYIDENISLGEIYFNSLKKNSQKTLLYISDTDETLTYSEVLTLSVRTALALKQRGIGRNDIISTCTYNQKYNCLPVIASLYLGAINANFDPILSHLDTVHLLRQMAPKILFVVEEALEFMERCLKESGIETVLVVFGESDKYQRFSEFITPHPDEMAFRPATIDHEETALILFSSGTTGLPKGICLSHRSLKNGGPNFCPMNITNKNPTVSLIFTSFYWISMNLFFYNSVINGYALVLCKKFNPQDAWRIFKKYKVTFTFLAPYNAAECLNNKPVDGDCSTVEVLFTGSCPVNEKLMSDLSNTFHNAKILNIYGQTESGSAISSFDPFNDEEYALQLKHPLSCGKVKKFIQWKIVDLNTEETLGPNKEGELRIKSNYLMNGYYKLDCSSSFDTNGYLKTGDVAYYDENNCLYVVDRIKEMFKYKGWHIIPAVIEDVLNAHPAVKDAVVIGVPCKNVNDGLEPMGIVTLREQYGNIDLNDIVIYVNGRVSETQKLRAGIKVYNDIPKTATAKPKRRELRQLLGY